jgi:hypothetical protein
MRRVVLVVALAAAAVTVARSGHELPVYPSYYPHEIEIASVSPERAASLLVEGKLHAYVGGSPRFGAAPPDTIRTIESLGSFVLVRIDPAKDAPCSVAGTVLRALAKNVGELVFHPYPVTPFHGDYLHHVDLAHAAKAGFAEGSAPLARLTVKAQSPLARRLVPPDWTVSDTAWDAEIVEVDAAALVASHMSAMNGWLGPPWIRAGWFHAHLVLGGAPDADLLQRLQTGDTDRIGRINLERDFVRALTADCRAVVAGYTVRREHYNAEFSAGIENIGYDALTGLASPMFLRTAKLKDFPWNGWLALGLDEPPAAAWNPVAGFYDRFGRLMWFAVGDPLHIPSPYDATWMLNRAVDVQTAPRR